MSMKTMIAAAAALAMLGGPSVAAPYGHAHPKAQARRHVAGPVMGQSAHGAAFDHGTRAAFGRGDDFEGWPTDYLTNRFGDHQAQGR